MSTYSRRVLADGPVAYWRLNDGATPAVDSGSGGNLHPGTISGGVTTGAAGAITGDADNAMTFDGSTGQISVPYAADLDITPNLTLEAWIYPLTTANNWLIEKTVGGTANTQYMLYLNAGVPGFRVYDASGNLVYTAGGSAVATNAWSHIVGTFDGANLFVYTNGTQTGTLAAVNPNINTGNGVTLLGTSTGFFGDVNGRLDEVAIYNTVLSPAEIMNHYHIGTGDADLTQRPPARVLRQAVKRANSY